MIYFRHFMEGLKKITKSLNLESLALGQIFKPGPPRLEASALPTRAYVVLVPLLLLQSLAMGFCVVGIRNRVPRLHNVHTGA
jgi:hypothetical protein